MSDTAPDPWICAVCRKPITWSGPLGVIEIEDRRSREKPGYDPDASEQQVALGDGGEILWEETAELQADAAVRMLEDPGVVFHVWHIDCAPEKQQGYVIECGRARRIENWIAWMRHLSEKGWMKRRDFVAMASFWCHGHGIEIPDDML